MCNNHDIKWRSTYLFQRLGEHVRHSHRRSTLDMLKTSNKYSSRSVRVGLNMGQSHQVRWIRAKEGAKGQNTIPSRWQKAITRGPLDPEMIKAWREGPVANRGGSLPKAAA